MYVHVHKLSRWLGALNAFNPYNPDFFWELDCKLGAKADERKVINILVLMEQKESGENWLNESRDWLKFDAPANWTEDEGLPHPSRGEKRPAAGLCPTCAVNCGRAGAASQFEWSTL